MPMEEITHSGQILETSVFVSKIVYNGYQVGLMNKIPIALGIN
jgi:hypothetical protein